MRNVSLVIIAAFIWAGCSEEDSPLNESGISFKGSCYNNSPVSEASTCDEHYSVTPSSAWKIGCEEERSPSGTFSETEKCSKKRGSFGQCKIILGDDGEYEITTYYGEVPLYDELSEQMTACSNGYSNYDTPEWIAHDTWGATSGISNTFKGTDGAAPSSIFTISGDGCEISSNQLLCKSTGGSSGKAGYNTAATASSQRISGELAISGGSYNGSGSGALAVLWADNANLDSATSLYGCGLHEGEFVIRDESGVLQTDSNTDVAVDGASFSVVFSIEGTTATCTISGSIEATLTHTLGSAPSGNGYSGFIAGWYDGANRNYAFWDDFKFETK